MRPAPPPARPLAGIVHCGQTVISEEGTRALWKGLTPFAMHLTLKYALRMGSNSVYQGLLRDKEGRLSTGSRLASGFMAGGGARCYYCCC
jgi:solute carrier family 25 citrate transporter 1